MNYFALLSYLPLLTGLVKFIRSVEHADLSNDDKRKAVADSFASLVASFVGANLLSSGLGSTLANHAESLVTIVYQILKSINALGTPQTPAQPPAPSPIPPVVVPPTPGPLPPAVAPLGVWKKGPLPSDDDLKAQGFAPHLEIWTDQAAVLSAKRSDALWWAITDPRSLMGSTPDGGTGVVFGTIG